MKLTVFQSIDGDCLLVTGKDGKFVLADGGRQRSFSACVAGELEKLRNQEKNFEAVYISHIDADHVEGIERLLGDLIEWESFDFRSGSDESIKPPKVPRPIRPKKFWHNSFHDQVDQNAGDIVDMLAASASVLSALPASASNKLAAVAIEHQNLVTSMKQAFTISTRIRKNLLNIRLNPDFDGKLMLISDAGPEVIKVGKMRWRLIGPGGPQLEKLRDDWNKWLETTKGADAIKEIQEQAAREQAEVGNATNEAARLVEQRSLAASMLAERFLKNDFSLAAKKEGRDGVTVPNLASLMFLAEEGKGKDRKTILMTGDGHWKDIDAGLKHRKLYDKQGNLHVNILKIPHHGASGNIKPEFLKHVTADHYVFCGISKKHHNPESDVVKQVLNSRLEDAHMGTHPNVDDRFKLWFSGSSDNDDLGANERSYIKKIEKLVAGHPNSGRFDTAFHSHGPSFDIEI